MLATCRQPVGSHVIKRITVIIVIKCSVSLTIVIKTIIIIVRIRGSWLWTNGVNANVAAVKIMIFDGFGEEVRPGTLGNIQVC